MSGLALDIVAEAAEFRETLLARKRSEAEGLRRELERAEAHIADLEAEIAELRAIAPKPDPGAYPGAHWFRIVYAHLLSEGRHDLALCGARPGGIAAEPWPKVVSTEPIPHYDTDEARGVCGTCIRVAAAGRRRYWGRP